MSSCPAERGSAIIGELEDRRDTKTGRAALHWTDEGICPDVDRAEDAHCNEMVAFLSRTKVICTLDAAVSVNSSLYALSSKRFKNVAQLVCVG